MSRPRQAVAGAEAARRIGAVLALVVLVTTAGCLGAFATGTETTIEFREVTADVGIEYTDHASGIGNGNAGVFVADIDRDGWDDVLLLGGDRPGLFVNDGGSFADETDTRLPELDRSFASALFFDYDTDGFPDLLLLAAGSEPVVLHNEGGTFERVSLGLDDLAYPQGATAADYDGDGDLDLFVYQSGDWADEKPAGYFDATGYIADDNGNPNVLYENLGPTEEAKGHDGTGDYRFRRVEDAGLKGDHWSLAASFTDLTGDGRPDIHVANDYNTDVVYVNRGDGSFDRRLLGGATARNGMASEIADVTGDGRPDIFVTNIYLPISRDTMSDERYERYERLLEFVIHSSRTKGNTLLVNDGGGGFVDRADSEGVREGGWGWAATLSDLDNDGDRDLLHTTQHVVRIDPEDPHYTYPMLWERTGDGFDSLDASDHGLGEHDGRGMATLDVDNDGDLDVVAATYGGPVAVYENVGTTGDSLSFRVVDESGATAIGAVVEIEAEGGRQTVWQSANVDYLSQESRYEHVGVGDASTVTVTVTWPDGTTRTFEDVPVDHRYHVTEDGLETVTSLGDAPEDDSGGDDGTGHSIRSGDVTRQ